MATMNSSALLSTCSRIVSSIRTLSRRLFGHHSRKKDLFTVAIEGNIGSGKTSLLNYFEDCPDVEAFSEPVAKWRDVDGHNALALMYQDPARWSFCLQSYVQLTMLDIHTRGQHLPIKLMERSIYSARYCFVENLHKHNNMSDMEYHILSAWFDWIIANQACGVDLIVYLRTEPKTVHERIKRRCRKEEKSIHLNYLKALHDLYEDWLIHKTKFSCPAPVLVLDGDCPLEDMKTEYEKHRENILFGYGAL